MQYAGSARHREPAGGSESSAERGGTVILTLALLCYAALGGAPGPELRWVMPLSVHLADAGCL